MPVPVSYPGVYVEELPSAVRTITGVPTSITAFVGRAWRGPVDVTQMPGTRPSWRTRAPGRSRSPIIRS